MKSEYIYLVGKRNLCKKENMESFSVLSIFASKQDAEDWLSSDESKDFFPWWFRENDYPIIERWILQK